MSTTNNLHTTPSSLYDFYNENYLQPATVVKESTDEPEGDKDTAPKKGKKSKNVPDAGALYDSTNKFDSIFHSIVKEFDEQYGEIETSDDFSADGFDEGDGDEEITVSKSVLRDLISQIQSILGPDDFTTDLDGGSEDSFDDTTFESYAFSGDGSKQGNGTYDGKAKPQPRTNHVQPNGNANVNKTQDTGYDPDDTEGHEGSPEGNGTYDGKAKPQPRTNLVQQNGDANVNKTQKTGIKPNTVKKNLF